ncbi:MAG: ComF family protein [Eubacterium sp.]|jgi:competence protein ComFC
MIESPEQLVEQSVKQLLRAGEDLLFPESIYCICCGKIIDSTRTYSLCDDCMSRLGWNIDPPIVKSGIPVIRCVDYGIYSRSIVFSLKYNKRKYVARQIAAMMADRLAASGIRPDCLVPVPIHEDRLSERGFNQSELISRFLSENTGIPTVDALVRAKKTRAMRGLGAAERAFNIEGSIRMKPGMEGFADGGIAALIDDFCTTGSTAAECARALEKSGAGDIFMFAFAARVLG